jgi:4-alpha-glucanotransferase
MTLRPPSHQLAERHGIEPFFWDIFGQRHETSERLRDAILTSLRVDAAAPADEPVLEPVYVLRQSHGRPLRVRMPEGSLSLRWRIRCEDGRILSGQQAVEPGMEQSLILPEELPLGYHTIEAELDGELHTSRLIICPERAWLPPALEQGQRRAGLAVCLWGVRSRSTWGCGDFTALEQLVDWVTSELHASYIALNPLHAIHNRHPFNTSPYLPNSLYYRNPIYLDVDLVEDVAAAPECQRLRHDPATIAGIAELNSAEFVEYERVYQLKLEVLRKAFEWFRENHLGNDSPRARRFRDYCAREGGQLHRFALYCALDQEMHRRDPDVWVWPDWPEHYRDPDSPAVAEFARQNEAAVEFPKYLQWLVDEQAAHAQQHALARGMEIGMLHDLPLATDSCGAELWIHRRLYVQGCRVGAPPDGFAPQGQDWSFPPPNREAHRADGYRMFAESIRKSSQHGGALRIDHVMRLFRLYWIPDGFSAAEGTYVRDHYEDLLGVLALESVRNKVLIVGEDLGTVEPWMREALARFGILSYRLFYFEKREDGSFLMPGEYPVQALVSSTTHDLPTLAGFWSGRDIDVRYELGLAGGEANRDRLREERRAAKHRMLDALIAAGMLDPGYPRSAADGPELTGELHNAVTGFLASTPCLLMTLNQEDLTKEPNQQNMPATTWQYPNWRRKMRYSVEDLRSSSEAAGFAAMLRHWLDRSGRARPPLQS